MQGTIRRVIRGKGFGFIMAEDRQFFFHHTEVQNFPFKRLSAGDVVEFQPALDDDEGRNPRATQVLVVAKAEPPGRVPRRRASPGGRSSPALSAADGRQEPPGRSAEPSPEPITEPASHNPDDDEFVSGDLESSGESFGFGGRRGRRPGGPGTQRPRRLPGRRNPPRPGLR